MSLPALGGNWVDLAILLLTLFYLLTGASRGFFLGLLDLGGFILSFFAALSLYPFLGELLLANFSLPKGIAKAAGFMLAGILAEIVFSLLINFLAAKWYRLLLVKERKNPKLGFFLKLDKILGVFPAVGEALILTTFILTLLLTLPIQGAIKKDIVSAKIGGLLVIRTQGIERELDLIFGQAINETLTFLTINPNPASTERLDLRFSQKEVKTDEAAETAMLTLINQERVKRGLRHLSLSFKLRELGREKAREMFAQGYFSHYSQEGQSPFERMDKAGIKYTLAGENLALAPNVELAHQGLMNSSGHRANILSPDFHRVGIGVIDGGIYGEMFVQEFTD